jgi:hypothetical protein
MANINVLPTATRARSSSKNFPNRGGAVASPIQCFTGAEVASLIRHHEEVSELVGTLIEAVSNMLPVGCDGEPEPPGAARLLAHCDELLGDMSFFSAYKSRIDGLHDVEAMSAATNCPQDGVQVGSSRADSALMLSQETKMLLLDAVWELDKLGRLMPGLVPLDSGQAHYAVKGLAGRMIRLTGALMRALDEEEGAKTLAGIINFDVADIGQG